VDLVRALEDASLAVLVGAISHITGDASWLDRYDAEHEQMVWRHPRVHSYYNNDDGRVVTNAPWRLLDSWRMTREPAPDDDEFVAPGDGEVTR
jgi:hypothetical protein